MGNGFKDGEICGYLFLRDFEGVSNNLSMGMCGHVAYAQQGVTMKALL